MMGPGETIGLVAVVGALMALVIVAGQSFKRFMAFRERRLGRGIAADDVAGQQASDARVLAVIFSAIIGGMLLTVIVAYIVFL